MFKPTQLAAAMSCAQHLSNNLANKGLVPQANAASPSTDEQTWFKMSLDAKANKAEIEIFEEIGMWGVSANAFIKELTALGEVENIHLKMHTPGGSIMDGLAIMNALANHSAKVTGEVLGLVASMGTAILTACDHVTMPENAWYMIHNPWGGAVGEADDLREYADLLDKLGDNLAGAYAKRTGKPVDEIKEMMKAETWMDGADALANGFVDEVTESVKAAASIDLSRTGFSNIPAKLSLGDTQEPQPEKLSKSLLKDLENQIQQNSAFLLPGSNQAQTNSPNQDQNEEDDMALKARLAAQASAQANAGNTQTTADDFKAAEQKRRTDIKAAFNGHTAHAELMNQCLDNLDCTVAQAKDELLKALGSQEKPVGSAGDYRGSAHVDDGKKEMAVAYTNAILARGGIKVEGDDHREFSGHRLEDIAKDCLQRSGVRTGGMNRMELIGASMSHSSSDFPNIITGAVNNSLLKGFEESRSPLLDIASNGSLPDFKLAQRSDIGQVPSLNEVKENAEFKEITFGDRAESAMLATHGGIISVSRQTIINDDLGALIRIPMKQGQAAMRTVTQLIVTQLLGAQKMSDNKALFHADHGNLLTAAAPTTNAIATAATKMRSQKDGDAYLDIFAKYLLCGTDDEITMRQILSDVFEFDASAKQTSRGNPIKDAYQVIADPRLNALNGFLMMADPMITDALEVLWLDGVQTPHLETQDGFTTDGVRFKVRLDAAAKIWDYRTINKTPKS